MSFNTKSSLLYHQEHQDDDYFSNAAPNSDNSKSYYKRSNLLGQSSTSSFRQKCKGLRARSSSYTSINDKQSDNNLLNSQDIPLPSDAITPSKNNSFFSRKNLGMTNERSSTAPASSFLTIKQDTKDPFDDDYNGYEDGDSDESTFFAKQGNYSRQNLSRSSSWKSCVLRAVGVKRMR